MMRMKRAVQITRFCVYGCVWKREAIRTCCETTRGEDEYKQGHDEMDGQMDKKERKKIEMYLAHELILLHILRLVLLIDKLREERAHEQPDAPAYVHEQPPPPRDVGVGMSVHALAVVVSVCTDDVC